MSSTLFAPITKLHLSNVSSIAAPEKNLYVLEMDVQKRKNPNAPEPMIAAACSDHSLRFFTRDKVNPIGSMIGHKSRITGVKFGKKNPSLCFTSSLDGTIRCWDTRMKGLKPPQIFTGYEGCAFTSFDVNCDDDVLCAGTELVEEDAYLMFWDVRSTNLLGAYKESHSDDITQVEFHPTKADSLATGSTDGLVCVFDIGKNNEQDALVTTLNSESTVQKIGWCGANSEYLYCLTDVYSLIVWDAVESSTLIKFTDVRESLKEDDCKIDYLVDCFYHSSLKSLLILGGTEAGELSLLSAGRDRLHAIHSLPGAHTGIVRCLNWDSKNEVLVTGGEDSILSVWRKSALDNPILMSEEELEGLSIGKDSSSHKATNPTQAAMDSPKMLKPRVTRSKFQRGRKPYGRGGGRGQFRR
ncbi:WD repeat-containing protein 89-like isoform X2 [Apostichopus japonicus]|uniref:WD repeat-containing protein 89-like isoform X2 n=1 Tax=Stichopus japonicus TaxID=307972 RepID=UPI003AB58B15